MALIGICRDDAAEGMEDRIKNTISEHERQKRQDKIESLLLEFADKIMACAQEPSTITYRTVPIAAKKLAKELSK